MFDRDRQTLHVTVYPHSREASSNHPVSRASLRSVRIHGRPQFDRSRVHVLRVVTALSAPAVWSILCDT
jgi:hypothetical protein